MFSSAEKCDVCGKKVYQNEKVSVESIGTNTKIFHKLCFKCKHCKKTLQPGKHQINKDDGGIYCMEHYQMLFVKKRASYVPPTGLNFNAAADDDKPMSLTKSTNEKPAEEMPPPAPKERDPSVEKKSVSFGKSLFGNEDVCPTCGKRVYLNDKVLAKNKPYHKQCLRCCECGVILNSTSYSFHQDKFYCDVHYKLLNRGIFSQPSSALSNTETTVSKEPVVEPPKQEPVVEQPNQEPVAEPEAPKEQEPTKVPEPVAEQPKQEELEATETTDQVPSDNGSAEEHLAQHVPEEENQQEEPQDKVDLQSSAELMKGILKKSAVKLD